MHQSLFLHTLFSLTFLAVSWGCTSHTQYRSEAVEPPDYKAVESDKADIVRGQNGYLLGFVEFDDQGTFWNREQAVGPPLPGSPKPLIERLEAGVEPGRAMHLIVFVHGWKHDASPKNENVKTFGHILKTLQHLENERSPDSPARVVGVYVGWRGLSLQGWLLTELTFWDRKNTAEKIGHGAVTDFLRQVEVMHDRRHSRNFHDDRLIIMGHSFGGAVVFSAISQILVDRFVEDTTQASSKPVRSFGDLVVLINPAFEAQRYDTLYKIDRSQNSYHGIYNGSLPVLAVLTSEADWATKHIFPIGRWFNTIFEVHRCDEDQKRKNRRTVGHYEPFQTHRLSFLEGQEDSPSESSGSHLQQSPAQIQSLIQDIEVAGQRWTSLTADTPCQDWKFTFGRTRLERKCEGSNVPVNSPYLVIDVDGEIINGHNDFANSRLLTFLEAFIPFATDEGHGPSTSK